MDSWMQLAINVAKTAHRGQKRKYTGEPYLSHPFAVAGLVASVTHDDSMVISALLHDVVEDSNITNEMIEGMFGPHVATLVDGLTDVSKPSDGNRAERKKIDRLHTAAAHKDAMTIKLADLIDNSKTIVQYDPGFAKVYMAEKRALLDVLQEGDQTLLKIAIKIVDDYYKEER